MLRDLQTILSYELLSNTLRSYLSAALTFALTLAGLFTGRRLLLRRLETLSRRTTTDLDDFVIELLGKIKTPEYHLFALYLATRSLSLSEGFNRLLQLVFVAVLSVRAVLLVQHSIAYGMVRVVEKSGGADPEMSAVFKNVRLLLNSLLWALAGVFMLDNLGIDISAAVAGLGIGGIAVAMAGQHILGDLFSSFVIFTDKPFTIGDAIAVGDLSGTVEHVGIKTTRIRSVSGELLIFANSDLTSSRIKNFKRMQERRVLFSLGLTYQTPADKIRIIPGMIRRIVEDTPGTRFDRAHFKGFGPSSLDFEVVYFVLSADYNIHMDVQERVSLAILESFGRDGIEFAYPTQTLILTR